MKINAFSLAETLVTLTVIGIVTTLMMPMLHVRYKSETAQTAFVNAFKLTNKAFFNYSMEQHCNGQLDCTDLFKGNLTAVKLGSQIDHTDKTSNCWEGMKINNFNQSGYVPDDKNDYPCIVDGNETIFATLSISEDCSADLYDGSSQNTTHKLHRSCGYLYIDTNGKTGPNTYGNDVFIFVITNSPPTYLYPVGGSLWKDKDRFPTVGACPEDGRTCAGKIVEDGWKINYF